MGRRRGGDGQFREKTLGGSQDRERNSHPGERNFYLFLYLNRTENIVTKKVNQIFGKNGFVPLGYSNFPNFTYVI